MERNNIAMFQRLQVRGSKDSSRQHNDTQGDVTSGNPSEASASSTRDVLLDITESDIKAAKWCGSGGYGEVFYLQHRTLGKLAFKRLRENGSRAAVADQRRRAEREAQTWRSLKHRHVLPFVGFRETEESFYIISEYAENGTLTDYIKSHPAVLRIPLLTDVASALAYLHSSGIIHGDVKAANVLISGDCRALVCDFGLSKTVDVTTTTALQGQGSIRWMSPELLEMGHGKSFASDVWAFGMLIYEVLSGSLPFQEFNNTLAIYHALFFKKARPPLDPDNGPTGEPYLAPWRVATLCWQEDPALRPMMEDAIRLLDPNTTSGNSPNTTIAENNTESPVPPFDSQRGPPPSQESNSLINDAAKREPNMIVKWLPGLEYRPVLDVRLIKLLRPPTIELHPLLHQSSYPDFASNGSRASASMFDVLRMGSATTAIDRLPGKWLASCNDPATFPRLNVICLICKHTDWIIRVETENPGGVTLWLVFESVMNHFMEAVVQETWAALPPLTKASISGAFHVNRKAQTPATVGYHLRRELIRGDFLLDMTIFGGIRNAEYSLYQDRIAIRGYPAVFELILNAR